jgi:hypothetical protein
VEHVGGAENIVAARWPCQAKSETFQFDGAVVGGQLSAVGAVRMARGFRRSPPGTRLRLPWRASSPLPLPGGLKSWLTARGSPFTPHEALGTSSLPLFPIDFLTG